MVSFFNKFRASKKAAEQQKKAKKADAASVMTASTYRHIPTHAAADAIAGVPSSYRERDRREIKKNHDRRSNMSMYSGMSAGSSYRRPASVRMNSWSDQRDCSKQRAKSEYRDSGIGRSPLSSVEMSPHISRNSSSKSLPVRRSASPAGSSSSKSDDSLPKIAEERDEICEAPHQRQSMPPPSLVYGTAFANFLEEPSDYDRYPSSVPARHPGRESKGKWVVR
ncbi:MAG: hypothetical protein M1833_000452 [Piccolia ochrophora]|nr:MAG: hypothetical protein M1833_000452 [Piccolia ochrophora]